MDTKNGAAPDSCCSGGCKPVDIDEIMKSMPDAFKTEGVPILAKITPKKPTPTEKSDARESESSRAV